MKTLKNILIIVLLAILALLAWPQIKTFLDLDVQVKVMPDIQQFEKPFQPQATPTVYFDPSYIVLELRNQSRLVTMTAKYQQVGGIEYNQEGNFIEKMQGEQLQMLFVGEVSAGVDLSTLTPNDITVSGYTINLQIPRSQIFDGPVILESETRVLNHETGFLTDLLNREDPNLQTQVRAQAEQQILSLAQQDTAFLQAADAQAVAIVSNLVNSLLPSPFQVIVTTR